jgi:hypothetical protein
MWWCGENFLTSCKPVSFSNRTLLHELWKNFGKKRLADRTNIKITGGKWHVKILTLHKLKYLLLMC